MRTAALVRPAALPHCLFVAVCCWILLSRGDTQARTSASPSGTYTVRIPSQAAEEKSSPRTFTLLQLRREGSLLREHRTFGYLLDVLWSPDERWVAVNNRRANSGDYLWVLSTSDGEAVRKPEDDLESRLRDQAVADIERLDKQASYETLDRYWIDAVEWKDANTLLARFRGQYYAQGRVLGTYRYIAEITITDGAAVLGGWTRFVPDRQ
ncbi:hypothetical protein [Dichotomicrobium thermohalophilum]|uniref:Uncharacterized protein n=1 Tax=Dichotomicrobium thermohalophilum TaxID=933063 RepID=A0A397Q430_9HYPH|nr:hypothetical protein [Dichotomicrobium thermohalophilum]RIA55808.1 hypothetical protein BXY53_0890 [Dichotomicrobium thermohalophilum]